MFRGVYHCVCVLFCLPIVLCDVMCHSVVCHVLCCATVLVLCHSVYVVCCGVVCHSICVVFCVIVFVLCHCL
jgi:hypothetical protein